MGIDFYIAADIAALNQGNPILLTLENDAYYWFLYRYFESANLDRSRELIGLYGEGALEGYQLDRLEDQMKEALLDIYGRPDTWNVLVGWKSHPRCRATEDWQPIEKLKAVELVQRILGLAQKARDSGLKLVFLGD